MADPTLTSGVKNYRGFSDEERTLYIQGVLDSLRFYIPREEKLAFAVPLIGCTDDMSTDEVRDLFDRWLDDHPEQWEYAPASVFFKAIRVHCKF